MFIYTQFTMLQLTTYVDIKIIECEKQVKTETKVICNSRRGPTMHAACNAVAEVVAVEMQVSFTETQLVFCD